MLAADQPDRMRAHLELIRWLGPWTPSEAVPDGVTRWSVPIPASGPGEGPLEAWAYRPTATPPRGALLLCPGLHYAGPADPRLDRFARILARAGLLVLAPFLPDFTALRVAPGLTRDLERALEGLLALPERPRGVRPGIFSISFGSLPTLRLAARTPHALGGLVIFGGYADWRETVRFCLAGRPGHPRDPLNQPVVLMNLIADLPGGPADPAPLLAAWRRYVESTWGRPEMKDPARHFPVARAIAAELPEATRALFLVGCGVEPGALALAEEALDRGEALAALLDPRPACAEIRCPVHLVHGLDDDVIPHTELERLAAALPPSVRVGRHKTGLYGHTGTSGLRGATALLKEASTLLAMLRAIVEVATTAEAR